MSKKQDHIYLPELIAEVESGLDYLIWIGGNSNLQAAWIDEIKLQLLEISKLEIGINLALDQLCYDLDQLALHYWPGDNRENQCRAIIDEILDFQIASIRAGKLRY